MISGSFTVAAILEMIHSHVLLKYLTTRMKTEYSLSITWLAWVSGSLPFPCSSGRFCSRSPLSLDYADWGWVKSMNERVKFSSGTRWEPMVGYSRAVKVGKMVHVSGTTATDQQGNLVGVGDAEVQTVQILKNLKQALESVGAKLEDVVRTRIYVTDIECWKEIGRAHSEIFHDIRPATTMVEVRRLIDPRILVEIEAEAILN